MMMTPSNKLLSLLVIVALILSYPLSKTCYAFSPPILLAVFRPSSSSSSSTSSLSQSQQPDPTTTTFLLVGGCGKIGTAVASHLLLRRCQHDNDPIKLILLARRSSSQQRNERAVKELQEQLSSSSSTIELQYVDTAWPEDISDANDKDKLVSLLKKSDVIIHTAGPYGPNRKPTLLELLIEIQQQQEQDDSGAIKMGKKKVYVDVSDPLPYLEYGCNLSEKASRAGITALLAAGAFPGMSNVLAMEAASSATSESPSTTETASTSNIQDLYFQYYTAGLGGSGTINLYITNLGFGDSICQYNKGKLTQFDNLSGKLLGDVDFGLKDNDQVNTSTNTRMASDRVGTSEVFAWPFPEAATVGHELQIKGKSIVCMGTAPPIWNTMLGLLVAIVPRQWWSNPKFSQFMADFSQPLVYLTDKLLQLSDSGKGSGCGETHSMRIDVTTTATASGGEDDDDADASGVTIIQAHDSFRQCVGQSCAEFALDCLEYGSDNKNGGGVYLPEQLYRNSKDRKRIVQKLTSTPGTFCYTGPVRNYQITGPCNMDQVLQDSK